MMRKKKIRNAASPAEAKKIGQYVAHRGELFFTLVGVVGMKKVEFMDCLVNEREGFSFGEPWRSNNRSLNYVIPLLRRTKAKRKYVTSFETNGNVVITDTGDINSAKIQNKSNGPVFFRMGEVLHGDTQERSFVMSRLTFPGIETQVKIVCVHASKGINSGTEFKTGSIAFNKDKLFSKSLFETGNVNQGESWQNDVKTNETILQSLGEDVYLKDSIPLSNIYSVFGDSVVTGPTGVMGSSGCSGVMGSNSMDDLAAINAKMIEEFNDVLKSVPLFDDQIGMIILDDDGLSSLDCFDIPISWKKLKEAIVNKECASISAEIKEEEKESKFPEDIRNSITSVLGQGFDEKRVSFEVFENQRAEVLAIKTKDDRYFGEIVTLDDDIIHIMLSRN